MGKLPTSERGLTGRAAGSQHGRRRQSRFACRAKNKSKSETVSNSDSRHARDDIGHESAGESERLRERNEELEHERQLLERHNISLRSQIEETKPGLAEKLEPHLEALFDQGTQNMVTMAPIVVMVAVTKLERLLVEYGIMPPSRRTEDPQVYVRLLKQRAARRRDKEHQPKTDAAQAATKSNDDAPPPASGDWPDLPDFLRRAAADEATLDTIADQLLAATIRASRINHRRRSPVQAASFS